MRDNRVSAAPRPMGQSGTSLADLLDRVVDHGAVVNGDIIIQLAGIDLIRLDLRLLLVGIETSLEAASKPTRQEAIDS